MGKYYLAVDIGASSGRHILGHMNQGSIEIEEIHRFENGIHHVGNEACWDLDYLFQEILCGMKKCKEAGKIPHSMGIDTWGVDFVLLDHQNQIIGNSVAYRDKRTEAVKAEIDAILSPEDLYEKTGIQEQIFNTIYQLAAVKKQHPEDLKKAETFLMIPDYFHYKLTGRKSNEYTNATTTQMINVTTGNWDDQLIQTLGLPRGMFQPILDAGSVLCNLRSEIQQIVGFDCLVVLPATHDTGSAVAAVPTQSEHSLYISSGTWSLMGTELSEANNGENSRRCNFTNEGGYARRYRYLKNIMGLWMIQSVKKELEENLSFAELCEGAEKQSIDTLVDCNDNRFLAPDSMIKEIKQYCIETGQQVPQNSFELAAVIYNSLAKCYSSTIEELEQNMGRKYDSIHVVGGGANAEFLNKLTAKYSNRTVFAGPVEATAIGNIMVQMLSDQVWADIYEARRCVGESFKIKDYAPNCI